MTRFWRFAGFVGLAVVIAMVAAGGAAHAHPRLCNTEIDWRAPPECPDADEFAAQLAALVGAPPPGPVRVAVRVRSGDRGFTLYLRILSTATRRDSVVKERKLEDPSCQVVAETAAIVVATSIDPLDSPTHTPLGDCPQLEDGELPGLLSPSVADRGVLSYPLRGSPLLGLPFDVSVGLMVGGDAGTLADHGQLAPSLHGVAALQRGRWRVELGGSHLFERFAAREEDPAMGSEISLSLLALRTCAELYRGWLLGSVCAGGEWGRFRARGVGVAQPQDWTGRYLALGGGLSIARLAWKNIYLRFDGGVWSPLVRPRFAICLIAADQGCRELAPLGQPAGAVARLFAGVEVVFR